MPPLVRRAERALPGLDAALVTGADDVPDVQTVFDVTAMDRDLGWSPRFDMVGGLSRPTATPSRQERLPGDRAARREHDGPSRGR